MHRELYLILLFTPQASVCILKHILALSSLHMRQGNLVTSVGVFKKEESFFTESLHVSIFSCNRVKTACPKLTFDLLPSQVCHDSRWPLQRRTMFSKKVFWGATRPRLAPDIIMMKCVQRENSHGTTLWWGRTQNANGSWQAEWWAKLKPLVRRACHGSEA